MIDWFAKIAEFVKLPTKWIATLAVGAGFLVVAPATVVQRLHLSDLLSKHGDSIGLTALVCGSMLTVRFFAWAYSAVKARREEARARLLAIELLTLTDRKEREVLSLFYFKGQNTLSLIATNPVVAGLLEKGILERVGPYGEQSRSGLSFPLTIPPALRKLLTAEFLQLSEGHPRPEDMARLG